MFYGGGSGPLSHAVATFVLCQAQVQLPRDTHGHQYRYPSWCQKVAYDTAAQGRHTVISMLRSRTSTTSLPLRLAGEHRKIRDASGGPMTSGILLNPLVAADTAVVRDVVEGMFVVRPGVPFDDKDLEAGEKPCGGRKALA